jgi:glycine cleavage system transcriptional repressor
MRHFAVSAIGRDRPGIVAAVTEVLLGHSLNIEDSQATILRGHFTMMLVVAAPDGVDADALRLDLGAVGERLELEALALSELAELDPATGASPSHIVTVYGADHPGIVHSVASALAEMGVNVIDVATHLVEEEGEQSLYAMMMEVDLPADVAPDRLEAELREVAERERLDLSVRAVEAEAL